MADAEREITGRIEEWGTVAYNPYTAPECGQMISGKVYGSATHKDGKHIRTSIITEVDGRYVMTSSGSTYLLGEPDPNFIKFCKHTGCHMPTEE